MYLHESPEFNQDCVPGLGQDWYFIMEDLARVWLRVTKDGESKHLEDQIARTKMSYVDWKDLLKNPQFLTMLSRIDQEQKAGSPEGVFAARMQDLTRALKQAAPAPKPQVAVTPEAAPTPPSRLPNTARLAIAFIVGTLAGSGLVKATQPTPPSHTTAAVPNR